MKKNELKCTDLRIGNYVNYENRPFEVIEISPVSLVVRKKIGDIFEMQHRTLDVAQPIELTEEVLLKIRFTIELTEDVFVTIGFKKGDTSPKYERYYSEVCGNGQSLFLSYDFYYDGQRRLKIIFRNIEGVENEFKKYDIKYIHELQNAYYLLTNEELEVKL